MKDILIIWKTGPQQCSPESPVASVFAGYSRFKYQLLFLDKQKILLLFLFDNFMCTLTLYLKSKLQKQ